jgi:anti-anti-sigma factor
MQTHDDRDRLHSPEVATTPGEFEVHVETIADAAVVHVAGELDLATAARLEEALSDVRTKRLVVDLTRCTFLDSAGIRVLATSVRDHSGDERAAFVTKDSGILRVLGITGLDSMVSIHPSVDDAL